MNDRVANRLILAVVALDHLRFVAVDGRVPPDLGLFYDPLPALWADYDPWSLAHTGGWYASLLLLLFRIFGLGTVAFQLPALISVLVVVWCAGRLGGARAAALAAAIPMVWVQGRVGWIHVPEAALLLSALTAWRADPELIRPRSGVGIAVLGALAVALRPSAVGWVALLGIAVGVRAGRRVVLPALVWVIASAPAAWEAQGYLAAKLAARERYAIDVPALLVQVPLTIGFVPGLTVLFGLVALRRAAVDRLLATWALVPMVLFVGFRAGIDNFTTGVVALVILAAPGLDRYGRIADVGPLLSLTLAVLVQWVPSPAPGSTVARVAGMLSLPAQDNLKNYARPHTGWGAEDIRALVDESCRGRPCRIGVGQGLFRPHGEDPGRFETFLSGLDGVELADLRDRAGPPMGLDAVVSWECPDGDGPWFRRFPSARGNVQMAIRSAEMRPVLTRQIDPGCAVTWWRADRPPRTPAPAHERRGPRGAPR